MNFAATLEDFGNRVAIILENGERITYQELAQQADAVYSSPEAPSQKRTLIAIECDNQLASVVGYLGALRNDCPALLVDADLAAEFRERLYEQFSIPAIWTREGSWLRRSVESPAVHPDLALLLSTSGSTGASKLVKLTLDNLQENAKSIASYLSLNSDERAITTLPLHYSYGLSVLNSHLCCGATVLLTAESVTSRTIWNFFREHEATSFAGVPVTFAMLKRMRFESMALPSLRCMTQAGGRLADDVVRWFAELATSRNQRFYVMYGQTEATARISYVPCERLLDKVGSVGISVPNGRIELVADDGSVITASGTVGQLRYVGPNVMMGYADNQSDLALGDMQHGTLLTGDLAMRDDDGYFYITGRLKRFIKIFGNRIGLDEVESQLRNKDLDVAVTGRDDLLVVAVRGNQSDPVRLAADISAWYRLHHSSIRIIPVQAFPLSSSGKIQYGLLLDELAL
ncbi:MAG TPA: AMP-binding protein [Burkholderiaceae bacterium]